MKIKKLLYYYVSFLGGKSITNLKILTSGQAITLETGLALLSTKELCQPYLRYN